MTMISSNLWGVRESTRLGSGNDAKWASIEGSGDYSSLEGFTQAYPNCLSCQLQNSDAIALLSRKIAIPLYFGMIISPYTAPAHLRFKGNIDTSRSVRMALWAKGLIGGLKDRQNHLFVQYLFGSVILSFYHLLSFSMPTDSKFWFGDAGFR